MHETESQQQPELEPVSENVVENHSEQNEVFPIGRIQDELPVPEEQVQVLQSASTKTGSGLLTGLAIGALVGALVGGATGAVVSANNQPELNQDIAVAPNVVTSSGKLSTVSAVALAATDSVVTVDVTTAEGQGSGSGVIYSSDGYIITNAHVVTTPGVPFDQTRVRVFLNDGTILPASVVGTAPYADIAVLKVEQAGLRPIAVGDSETTGVGDLAIAIGAPFNLSNTVTSGVVSTIYRGIAVGSALIPGDETVEEQNPWNFDFDLPGRQQSASGGQVTLPVIQTDADINPGNSGGALLNDKGELIGVNVAIASAGVSQERAGSVGLGFAIPVNLATRVADSIISGNQVTHGLLGATVADSRSSETSTVRGGLVKDVVPGQAAQKSGIQPGDVITSINKIPTPDGTSVSAMVRYFESGTTVEVEILRNGQTLKKDIVLGSLT